LTLKIEIRPANAKTCNTERLPANSPLQKFYFSITKMIISRNNFNAFAYTFFDDFGLFG